MALEVEDGTGKANAESYVSVADATTYNTNLNRADWSALAVAAQEAALREATQHIDDRFFRRFVGEKFTSAQALQWPRQYAYDQRGQAVGTDEIPADVVEACIEYAYVAATVGTLSPVPTLDTGGEVVEKEERAGPVLERTRYAEGGSSKAGRRRVPKADRMLRKWLRFGGAPGAVATRL